jgi:hypothetical protein
MNHTHVSPSDGFLAAARESMTDPIISLAVRIARRADELAHKSGAAATDYWPWLRAEEEILGHRLPEPSLPMVAAGVGAGAVAGS